MRHRGWFLCIIPYPLRSVNWGMEPSTNRSCHANTYPIPLKKIRTCCSTFWILKKKLLFQICLFWFLFSAISSNKNIHENLGCDCHGVHAFLGASTPELLWLLEVSLLGSDHLAPCSRIKTSIWCGRLHLWVKIIVIWSLWYIYISYIHNIIYICFFEKGFY